MLQLPLGLPTVCLLAIATVITVPTLPVRTSRAKYTNIPLLWSRISKIPYMPMYVLYSSTIYLVTVLQYCIRIHVNSSEFELTFRKLKGSVASCEPTN